MKTQFETEELEALAKKVVELIKPILSTASIDKGIEDPIYDVEGIAEYLDVSAGWVYERTCRNEIPFFKMSRFVRFRKSEIDRWLSSLKIPTMKPLSASLARTKQTKGEGNEQR